MTTQARTVRTLVVSSGLLSVLFVTSAFGQTAPAGLRGKSVRISWTDDRVERTESGRDIAMTQTTNVKLYVGATGRVFSHLDRSVSASQSRQDLDVSSAGRAVLNFHAEGDKLVGDQVASGGARRFVVTFGQDFGSCSVDVIHGASGKRTRHLNLAKTQWMELVSIKLTSTSCAVTAGNAFGNS